MRITEEVPYTGVHLGWPRNVFLRFRKIQKPHKILIWRNDFAKIMRKTICISQNCIVLLALRKNFAEFRQILMSQNKFCRNFAKHFSYIVKSCRIITFANEISRHFIRYLDLRKKLLDGRAEALGPLLFYSCLGVKADCLK